jgi:hypothetical protein
MGFEYRVNGGPPVDVGAVLQAIVSTLSPGTSYLFEVRSYDRVGIRSVWVPVVGVTEGGPGPSLSGFAVAGPGALFTWTEGDAEEADLYELEISAPESI